ncbi:DUF4157 domain-containing protein [Kitasatospora sp. NBC_01560]|uniref:eCIS core domain-containing protein n=1 Tax=Kitasatospora sp. NBC_01560 TaxID=2975965 RepID=UPI003865E7A5
MDREYANPSAPSADETEARAAARHQRVPDRVGKTPAANARRDYPGVVPGPGGTPLAAVLPEAAGPRFDEVRVHADDRSDRLAARRDCRAFTADGHIHLRRGEFAPLTGRGRALVVHEATHVLQQRLGGPALQREEQPKEAPDRLRAPTELPPGRTYRVVLVGSPGQAEVRAGHALQFVRAAQFAGSGSGRVWLVERTGYEEGKVDQAEVRARAGGAYGSPPDAGPGAPGGVVSPPRCVRR